MRLKERLIPFFFILPSLFLMLLIVVYPLTLSFLLSLFKYRLTRPERPFIGLENYITYLTSTKFMNSLLVTTKMVVGSVVGSFLIGFSLALLLKRNFKGRGIVRSILILPWAVPGIAAITVFNWLFDPQFGVINYILLKLGLIQSNVGWLIKPSTGLLSIVLVMIWKFFPVAMLFLLAGLQSIPEILYEAAMMDGANILHRFVYITLPKTKGIITTVLLFLTIFSFGQFTFTYVMTGGGPARATETIVLQVYEEAFYFLKFGYASAIGVVALVISLMLSIIFIKYGGAETI